MEKAFKINPAKGGTFMDKARELLPKGGNLDLCLTCGACASGCPATGLEGMDPRKFLRMAALGMDAEITRHPWVWMWSKSPISGPLSPSSWASWPKTSANIWEMA